MNVPLRFILRLPAAILVLGLFHPVAATERPLEGRVIDREGRGIPGATVFLTGLVIPSRGACGVEPQHRLFEAPRRGPTTLTSGSDGTFQMLLPAGRYQVAASKPGYDTSLSEVNTLSSSPLRLRLLPGEIIRLGNLPVGPPGQELGMRWILRRQAGDVLRDEEPAMFLGSAGDRDRNPEWPVDGSSSTGRVERPVLAHLLAPLNGQVVQAYSGGSLVGGEAAGPGDSAGRSTAVLVGGDLDHGRWMFDGWSGKSSSRLGADRDLLAGHRADRVLVGIEYSSRPGDRVSADLEYGSRRYSVEPRGDGSSSTDQDQRSVEARSRWERRLSDRASVYVAGSYFETGVRAAGVDPFAFDRAPAPAGLPQHAVDRSLLAGSGVRFDVGGHHLELEVRSRRYRYELRDQGVLLYNPNDSWSVAETGTAGQSVSLHGGDAWRVAPRYALSYGLGYHAGPDAQAGCLVPRMGLTRDPSRPGGIRLSSDILWRIDPSGSSGSAGGDRLEMATQPLEPGRLGYLVGIEMRPDQGLQIAASLSYRPFEEGFDDDGGRIRSTSGVWGDAPLFLGDGRTGRREIDLQLARRFGPVSGSLSGRVGQARGQLTPVLLQAPIQVTAPGELRYVLTSLRALYMPTDTEIQVEYRRVSADALSGFPDPGAVLDYSRLDLAVYQDMPWLRNVVNARWKLLMAYQGLNYGAQRRAAGGSLPSGTASRLTGGVNVSF